MDIYTWERSLQKQHLYYIFTFLFLFGAIPSSYRSQIRFSHATRSNISTSNHIQGPFRIATLPPEVHRISRQIVGRPPSEGNAALSPNHFGGVQCCLFWLNTRRTPTRLSPPDVGPSRTRRPSVGFRAARQRRQKILLLRPGGRVCAAWQLVLIFINSR